MRLFTRKGISDMALFGKKSAASGDGGAKESRKEKKDKKKSSRRFESYPYLMDMKPKEKYVFHSDYFEIDNQVATIMAFFHVDGRSM